MAPKSAAAFCVMCVTMPVEVARWQPLITEASARFGVPESWIARVMAAESAGRTMMDGKPIQSPTGAIGLMQLMPKTYEEMRRRYGLGPDPSDPRDNILAGAAYLRAMYQAYGYPNLFAAYNVGPGRFDAFLLRRQPLPDATIAYMNRLVPGNFLGAERRNSASSMAMDTVSNGLFFALGGLGNTSAGKDTLFVPLSQTTR